MLSTLDVTTSGVAQQLADYIGYGLIRRVLDEMGTIIRGRLAFLVYRRCCSALFPFARVSITRGPTVPRFVEGAVAIGRFSSNH